MKKHFIHLSHKLIANAKIAPSSTDIKHKKINVYIFSMTVFIIPNEIIAEGFNFINEMNEGLASLNQLYINITNTMGNLGSNLFLSNSNMVWPNTPQHGYNGIGTFIQVQTTQSIQPINPFTNTQLPHYGIKRMNNLFNSIMYFFTLAALGIIGNYFWSCAGESSNTQNNPNSSVSVHDYAYPEPNEAERARRTAEKGKRRARDDDDDDRDRYDPRWSLRPRKEIIQIYTSEMRAQDRFTINLIFNYVRTLGGWTYPVFRTFMRSREPDADMVRWPIVGQDIQRIIFMNEQRSQILHTGIRQTLRNFIYPRLCVTQEEWEGYHTDAFFLAYLGYVTYKFHMFMAPVQNWRFYPNAIYNPYMATNADLDLMRCSWIDFDFVSTVHTEAQLRRILYVPMNVTLQQYIGLTWYQIKGIFDALREQNIAPRP